MADYPYTERQFFAMAYEHYTDCQRLRTKLDRINETRFSQHEIPTPDSIIDRTTKVYTWLLQEKLGMAMSSLADRTPQFIVQSFAVGNAAQAAKDIVRNWLQGVIQWADDELGIIEPTTEDNLLTSRAYIWMTPDYEAWKDIPQIPDEAEDDEELEDYNKRVIATRRAQDEYRMAHPPFKIRILPAESVVPEFVGRRTTGAWIFEEVSVKEVLQTFTRVTDAGERVPLATNLAASVRTPDLTPRMTCTLITYVNEKVIMTGVSGLVMARTSTSRPDAHHLSTEELFYEHEHGLGRLPLAVFRGRETNAKDPTKRFLGFLDPVEGLVRRYDEVRTQLHSSARLAAWPGGVETVDPKYPNEGDDAEDLEFEEGGITQLPPGRDVKPLQLTDAASYQILGEDARLIKHDIDMKTFPEASYGDSNATSGYQQNLVTEQAERVLKPWKRGLKSGWADFGQLALCCATAIMDHGMGSVPIRTVGEDESRFVTLKAEHVKYQWNVSAEIESRPVGGEAGLAQTLANEVNNGWISRLTAMERLGVQSPQREIQRILHEQVLTGQPIVDLLRQVVIARSMPLAMTELPQIPEEPVVPEALAQITQSPSLLGRLPPDAFPNTTGMPPIGGLPSPGTGDPAPQPPGIGTGFGMNRPDTAGVGGPGFGNGQAMPGGLARQ